MIGFVVSSGPTRSNPRYKSKIGSFCRWALAGWDVPAIRSGNSFLRARQSSVNQLSSSGVIILMVV